YVNDIALKQWWPQILHTFAEWGVAGIKFGFVSPEPRDLERILGYVADCMQRRMLVVIHDDFRPTGLSRTYPNLLTQEGVRGNEHFPGARHNCILPFTRFLAGPADYTFVYRTFVDRPCLGHVRQIYC